MDLLVFFISLFLGMIAGVFTGLIPGIHINLISNLILINLSFLSDFASSFYLSIFIISMSVMHTFIDFIPSICIGVPSDDTYLSVLPAHQMILSGNGLKAIFLSSAGSLFGSFFIVILSPLFFLFLKDIYSKFVSFIPYLLIFVAFYLVFSESSIDKKFWAFFTFLLSGSFGLFVLNSPSINNPLLYLFTGMFGLSSIFFSIFENSKIPSQSFNFEKRLDFSFFKAVFYGGFSASICSISPGMGNAQAASIGSALYKNIDHEKFIVLLSAINTINFVLSIFTLYIISKSRNGAILTVSQILNNFTFQMLLVFVSIVIFVSIVAFFLTLFLGKQVLIFISKVNLRVLNFSIFFLIFFIILMVGNLFGLVILFSSFCLGVFVNSIGIRRVHLMNVLLVPIVFNLIF